MSLKRRIYQVLVNRHIGITQRYHSVHDGTSGVARLFSWVLLLWWNFAYYILFCHFLGEKKNVEIYEEKRILITTPESAMGEQLSAEQLVEALSCNDVISFDIFDTLIIRPFSAPTDLFYLLGTKLEYMNFHDLRIAAEHKCRQAKYLSQGTNEVTLREIWNQLQEDTGLCAESGASMEEEMEFSLCYANPFMKEVFYRLREQNKRIVITSDMYLSHDFLTKLLEYNGYTGFERLYVSCDHGCSKSNGGLYKVVKRDLNSGEKLVHVGDNEKSDVRMAIRSGLEIHHYPNVNRMALSYRTFDMSVMVGGAYRGIVDNHLYCGGTAGKVYPYSMEYEYGFVYGGLFVLGYCGFIHDYCQHNGVDKILFLSRDGDILKQAYNYLYPDDDTVYAYWSRKAAIKLAAVYDKQDWFRRFLFHKVNNGYTIRDIVHSMELDFMLLDMRDWNIQEKLTEQNALKLKQFLEERWDEILEYYERQHASGKAYYKALLGSSKRAVAVDIGWAGSGAMVLRKLFFDIWKFNCELTGIIAGTNTVYNAEPNASETFLQTGALVSYLYSQQQNRDLWKKHDPNQDYNVYWEILLSSPTPQFEGFYLGRKEPAKKMELSCDVEVMPYSFGYLEDLDISLRFGKCDANQDGIREIQKGIMDFVREYHGHFREFPYMFRISGRDAYAPMLVAASHHEKYLKEIQKRFALEIQVN